MYSMLNIHVSYRVNEMLVPEHDMIRVLFLQQHVGSFLVAELGPSQWFFSA